jgi:UDP-N-acetyl-2-amino-2-deoxyglucuronate dehydrogenase
MSDIGFAVIGQGVGYNHTRRATQLERGHLAAVCDLRQDLCDRAAKEFGVPTYTDYREMLEKQKDINVVFICTPAGYRREIALDCFDAGKHVILTKPMEITIERCDDIIRKSEETGLKLLVDYTFRYTNNIRALKKAADDGVFGQLLMGKAELKWFRNQEYYDHNGGWRGTWRLDGGGSLANQTIHYIDELQMLMGEPESVFAYVGVYKWNIEAEDQGVAVMRFKNGGIATIAGGTTAVPHIEMNRVEVLGTKGNAISMGSTGGYEAGAEGKSQAVESWYLVGDDGEAKLLDIPEMPAGPPNVMAEMCDVLLDGATPMTDGYEGRKAVEIINAIYISAQTGKEVKFPLEKGFVPKDGYTRGI